MNIIPNTVKNFPNTVKNSPNTVKNSPKTVKNSPKTVKNSPNTVKNRYHHESFDDQNIRERASPNTDKNSHQKKMNEAADKTLRLIAQNAVLHASRTQLEVELRKNNQFDIPESLEHLRTRAAETIYQNLKKADDGKSSLMKSIMMAFFGTVATNVFFFLAYLLGTRISFLTNVAQYYDSELKEVVIPDGFTDITNHALNMVTKIRNYTEVSELSNFISNQTKQEILQNNNMQQSFVDAASSELPGKAWYFAKQMYYAVRSKINSSQKAYAQDALNQILGEGQRASARILQLTSVFFAIGSALALLIGFDGIYDLLSDAGIKEKDNIVNIFKGLGSKSILSARPTNISEEDHQKYLKKDKECHQRLDNLSIFSSNPKSACEKKLWFLRTGCQYNDVTDECEAGFKDILLLKKSRAIPKEQQLAKWVRTDDRTNRYFGPASRRSFSQERLSSRHNSSSNRSSSNRPRAKPRAKPKAKAKQKAKPRAYWL